MSEHLNIDDVLLYLLNRKHPTNPNHVNKVQTHLSECILCSNKMKAFRMGFEGVSSLKIPIHMKGKNPGEQLSVITLALGHQIDNIKNGYIPNPDNISFLERIVTDLEFLRDYMKEEW